MNNKQSKQERSSAHFPSKEHSAEVLNASKVTLLQQIQEKIEERSVSQEHLAKVSGVSQSTLSRIITGATSRPHQKSLIRIAEALGINTQEEVAGKSNLIKKEEVERALSHHLVMIQNWSKLIQVYGMREAVNAGEQFLEPTLFVASSRFERDIKNEKKLLTVSQLLESDRHYCILGDPGAGKTTLLKKIARDTLENKEHKPVVLVRLRDLFRGRGLIEYISGIFFHDDSDSNGQKWKEYDVKNNAVVCNLLDDINATVLIDGIDELLLENRGLVLKEIEYLLLHLKYARLFVTVRTGDFYTTLKNAQIIELAGFAEEQIRLFAMKWLGDAGGSALLSKIRSLPYSDVLRSPLLLTQMCAIYGHYGYLPESPRSLYNRLFGLMLEGWDAQRGIRRQSDYSSFTPDIKEEFLSRFAFELLLAGYNGRCSESVFLDVYERIHRSFDLPLHDARKVLREIQSHTGLIVQCSFDQFEFSHLSLFEYLAASYIVRTTTHNFDMLINVPGVMAVATALSSDGSTYMTHLLNNISKCSLNEVSAFLREYISRVEIEKPRFSVNVELGWNVLAIYTFFSDLSKTSDAAMSVCDAIKQFIQIENIVSSIKTVVHEGKILGEDGVLIVNCEKVSVNCDVLLKNVAKGHSVSKDIVLDDWIANMV